MRKILVLTATSGLLWLLYGFFHSYGLFHSASFVEMSLSHGAVIMTAALLVLFVAWLILDIGLNTLLRAEATGLMRVLVYSVLTFIGSAVVLTLFGFDVGAILTTSALLGAVVGLAMQPTLGSLVSGFAMQADKSIGVGSGILFRGERMEVISVNWRHVVARRRDNILSVIPNALLANEDITVFPEDRSTRFDVFLPVSVQVPPHQVTDMLAEGLADMEHLDTSEPIMIAPVEVKPEIESTIYRIRCFARYYMQIGELEGELLRRSWYILKRHGITMPASRFFRSDAGYTQFEEDRLHADFVRAFGAAAPDAKIDEAVVAKVLEDGRMLAYAPTERIVVPERERDRLLLLLRGRICLDEDVFMNILEYGLTAAPYLPPMIVQHLPRTALLRSVADRLAEDIGSYAEVAVREAVHKTRDMNELLLQLGEMIEDGGKRAAFLGSVAESDLRGLGPGIIAETSRDVTGRFVAQPHMRALDECVFLSVSAENLRQIVGGDGVRTSAARRRSAQEPAAET